MRSCLLVAGVLGLGLHFGCGAKSTEVEEPEPGSGSGAGSGQTDPAPPVVKKVLHIALEYIVVDDTEDPVTTRVSLIFTDQTGSSRRDITGEFPGGCSDVTTSARREDLAPLLGLDCWTGESGVHLRYVHRRNKIYVVKALVAQGDTNPAYVPLKEIDLPRGVPIKTDYDDVPAASDAPGAETN